MGKPTERSKPGNRGKRDSQILLLRYLNRVHFDLAMAPLELEIYHQMRNVIGIDPAFYEYIFTVDADTVRYMMIFITHLLIFFIGWLDCYTGLSQSFGRFQCRRLQDYWHMWRNQAHERRRLVVDYDSSL